MNNDELAQKTNLILSSLKKKSYDVYLKKINEFLTESIIHEYKNIKIIKSKNYSIYFVIYDNNFKIKAFPSEEESVNFLLDNIINKKL